MIPNKLNQRPGVRGSLQHPGVIPVLALTLSVLYGMALGFSVHAVVLALIPAALVVVLLAFIKPEYAAVVLLGTTWGFISDVAVKYYGLPSITKSLVGLLAVGLLLRRFTGRRVRLVYDPTTWWMLAYLGIVSLGVWYARYPELALEMTVDLTKDILIYVVLINLLNSTKVFEYGIWSLLAVGALLGTLTVYQELTHTYTSDYSGLARMQIGQIDENLADRPRAGGTTGEPNAYGQQLIVLVPLGLWALLNGRSLAGKAAAGFATAACLAGIGLSFSRGAYLALAAALGLYAIYIRLNPRYLLPMIALVGILLWAAPPEFTARVTTMQDLLQGSQGINEESSFRGRSVEMRMAINMFADHPLLGVGGLNAALYYPEYIREAGSPVADEPRPPHSLYLEVAAEHGLPGLLIFLGILFSVWQRQSAAWKLFAEAGNQRMQALAAALQVGYAGYLVTSIFVHGAYPRFLWLQVAMGVAFFHVAQRYRAQQSTEPATVATPSPAASPLRTVL